MRLILGLDRPTRGSVTVNGKPYAAHPSPLHEVGALLEARSIHTGRSARNHLRALAQTHGIGNKRVEELIDLVGLHDVARKRAGKFSLGMGQRLGIATALLGDPQTVMLDEPVNGLDPEGIQWIRTILRGLASEGRTVFVSSHLMSEMALTADHLIVIGRGRLIADTSVSDFVAGASKKLVHVRSPAELGSRRAPVGARGDRRRSRRRPAGGRRADGCRDRRSRCDKVARAARAHPAAGIARGGVHGSDARRARVRPQRGDGMSAITIPRLDFRGKVTLLRVIRSEWTKLDRPLESGPAKQKKEDCRRAAHGERPFAFRKRLHVRGHLLFNVV